MRETRSRGRGLRRRWLLTSVTVVAALLAASLVAWFVWLPRYRPRLAAGERYGVDVSNHQGAIDWPAVAADGISFAYIKATEGGDFVDPFFGRNWQGASATGLDRGAYHFFTLCPPGSEQAANFLRALPEEGSALPPALDLELAGNCSERPDGETVERDIRSFMDAVEAGTGQSVLLYVGDDFDDRYHARSRFDRSLWVHRFLLRPQGEWLIWQVGGFASVHGIQGHVDLDVMRVVPR